MNHILLIEDETDSREAIHDLLRQSGYECTSFGDAEAALAFIAAGNHPDIAVVDLALPGIDGFEFKRRVGDGIVCLAITAFDGGKVRNQAFSVGYDGYLPKPYTADTLIETIQALLTAA